ncbi:hypothetical protein EV664_103223 [Stakelama pacifica]|uniref:Uncharacterized protein n=1 Tax=Stakelama pacifica TaxID=517720 RepID=A0A4R6FSJ4_9SPHN|nr:hypothetical protein EV664_103223 [Stakelama pacifica]
MTASAGSRIWGSGTSSMRMPPTRCQTTAFMGYPICVRTQSEGVARAPRTEPGESNDAACRTKVAPEPMPPLFALFEGARRCRERDCAAHSVFAERIAGFGAQLIGQCLFDQFAPLPLAPNGIVVDRDAHPLRTVPGKNSHNPSAILVALDRPPPRSQQAATYCPGAVWFWPGCAPCICCIICIWRR